MSAAASAEAPSSPNSLSPILRARGGAGMVGEQACQRALAERRTLKSRFEPQAYTSSCSVELPLSPSARAAPPSEPSSFFERLRARGSRGVCCEGCQWALTHKRTLRGAAAHSKSWICVSLRTSASSEAPSANRRLCEILQALGRMGTVREL